MTTLPPRPWHTVNIDFCGPFPGSAYLLVAIDAYSRFPEVEIVSSTSAQSTILKLKRIFATHGIPEVLKSDNGHCFIFHVSFFKKLSVAKHDESSHLWNQIDEDDYLSDSDLGDMVGQNDPVRGPVRYPVRRRQRVQRFGNNIYD